MLNKNKIRTNFKTKNKNINKEEKKTRDISDIDKNLVKIEFKNRRRHHRRQ